MIATFTPFPTSSVSSVAAVEERPSLPGLPPLPAAGSAAIPPAPVLPTMPSKASLFSMRPAASLVEEMTATGMAAPALPADELPDYTDEDLTAALAPVMEQSLQQTLHQSGSCMDTQWEPWLRSTIRRALAEQRSLQDTVDEPGLFERFCWRIAAFFQGGSYEQMLWEDIKRFRVEEVYLLERGSRELLSHAGIGEPGFSQNRRIVENARRLAESLHDDEGTIRLQFRQPRGRKAEVRVGRHAVLIAVVLGEFPEALRVDLDYCLRRVEERFSARFANRDESLARVVQTYLEECLLIAMPGAGH